MLNLASGVAPKPGPVEGGSFMKVYLISATETMLHDGSDGPGFSRRCARTRFTHEAKLHCMDFGVRLFLPDQLGGSDALCPGTSLREATSTSEMTDASWRGDHFIRHDQSSRTSAQISHFATTDFSNVVLIPSPLDWGVVIGRNDLTGTGCFSSVLLFFLRFFWPCQFSRQWFVES